MRRRRPARPDDERVLVVLDDGTEDDGTEDDGTEDDGAEAAGIQPDSRARDGADGDVGRDGLRRPRATAGHGRQRQSARHRQRWVLAAVVVLAVVVGANVLDARRDAARLAAVQRLPHVLEPLPRAPVERWRVDGALVSAQAGVVLVVGRDGTVRAVDAATGAGRWSWAPGTRGTGERCVAGTVDPAPVLYCGTALADVDGWQTGVRTAVLAVDARDGSTVAEIPVRAPVLDMHVVDGDVVVLAVRAGAPYEVTRWSPRTRAVVWRTTSDRELSAGEGFVAARWDLGQLRVQGRPTFVVDLATGADVTTAAVADGAGGLWDERVALPGGRVARWRGALADGPTGPASQVVDGDGTVLWSSPGEPFRPLVDDGSADDVVLLQAAGGVRAARASDGETRWAHRLTGEGQAWPVALVDDALLVVEGNAVVVRGMADGTPLWSVDVGALRPPFAATDGRRVVVARPGVDGVPAAVSAHRFTDGVEQWRTALPEGAERLLQADDRLLVLGPGWVAGLGPADAGGPDGPGAAGPG